MIDKSSAKTLESGGFSDREYTLRKTFYLAGTHLHVQKSLVLRFQLEILRLVLEEKYEILENIK